MTITVLAALCCLTLPTGSGRAADTEQLARRYLELVDQGSAADFERFVTNSYVDGTPSSTAAAHYGVARQARPVENVGTVVGTGDHVWLQFQARGIDGPALCQFVTTPSGPIKVVEIKWLAPVDPGGLGAYRPSSTLEALTRQVRADLGVPGLAVAVASGAAPIEVQVAGRRKADGRTLIAASDRFHYGSITKSMTATIIATLIEEGKLSWDTTIQDILAFDELRAEYRTVTVTQLLSHCGGLPADTGDLVAIAAPFERDDDDPTAARGRYARATLSRSPGGPVGAFRYSNAGYVVLGHMAEVVTGRSWEQLLSDRVFKPAGMTQAGVGWPRTDEHPDQPWRHGLEGDRFIPIDDELKLGPVFGPAGDAHGSILDLARYGLAHLRSLDGSDGAPWPPDAIRRLHQPRVPATPYDHDYAMGWRIENRFGHRLHWHSGFAGQSYAEVFVVPELDLVIAIGINSPVPRDKTHFLQMLEARIIANASSLAEAGLG